MIQVTNLCKSFGNLDVLRGITTEIKEGEKVVVIGPSGSGKSTFPVSYTHLHFVRFFCEVSRSLRLEKRFTAAQSNSIEQRIFFNIRKNGIQLALFSAVRIVCLRVVTSGACMRTALKEYCRAQTCPINDRFSNNS